ncbi:MAG: permease prefix domain 1-containing protein [Limisphaerales bacterium]
MNRFRAFLNRFRSPWHRRKVKLEIDEELRFHLEQRTAENIASGMTPGEAAREARKRFGNLLRMKPRPIISCHLKHMPGSRVLKVRHGLPAARFFAINQTKCTECL